MKVSVIIPVYNGEKTIERCLNSVLNQTLKDIEVIVVNDGSTDKTSDILNGFTDSRLKIITQENAGQGFARNTGIDAATGEYVGFVDSDDTIEPEMYEEMYRLAAAGNADVVQCRIMCLWQDGRKKVLYKSALEGSVSPRSSEDYIAVYLARGIHSPEICNKIFRRKFMLSNNLRFGDTKKYFSEDTLFNIRMIGCLKSIYFCPKIYYNYYQYPESHMHKGAEIRIKKIQILFDDCIENLSGGMKNAVSIVAALDILSAIGACVPVTRTSEEAAGSVGKKYIRNALKSKCGLKRRLYLTAVLLSPVRLRIWLAGLLRIS